MPEAGFTFQAILLLAVVASIAANVRQATSNKAQKREIVDGSIETRQKESYVTTAALNGITEERRRNNEELKQMIRDLRGEIHEDFKEAREAQVEVFQRLNDHATRLARLEGANGSRKPH